MKKTSNAASRKMKVGKVINGMRVTKEMRAKTLSLLNSVKKNSIEICQAKTPADKKRLMKKMFSRMLNRL
jgi:hypothetical protein